MSEGKYEGYRLNTSGSQGIGATATKPQVKIGDIVMLNAVDWALHAEQTSVNYEYSCIHAKIYGEVVALDDESIAVAPQVFDNEDVRCTLVVPLVCIKEIIKLGAA